MMTEPAPTIDELNAAHPATDDVDSRSPTRPVVDDAEAKRLWDARLVLGHIHDFARARRASPWAVLGAVLARVVASTKPFVQLPAIIGSYASLNLFVGLVGASGTGKDAAAKVAKDAIEVGHFLTAPLGSGEGLAHMFMRETKEGPEQYNDAALVIVGEIDTMTALVKRQASTVAAQLRQAAMGEQLGFFYVDTSRRMLVPEHRYRLCLIAGIQPGRAANLLDDTDGGTPQRFLWLPATYDHPDDPPPCPNPMAWESPPWQKVYAVRAGGLDRVVMKVCREATDTIDAAHLARARGRGDALDGHALLTRLKTAAALAILDGHTDVDDEDWALSGVLMAVSDATRNSVVATLAADQRNRNRQQAEAEASRTIVVQERVHEAAVARVAKTVRRTLARADATLAHADLRRAVNSRDRQYLDAAVTALVLSGDIAEEKIEYQGQPGTRYRLGEGAT